jgi:hypothetical protein
MLPECVMSVYKRNRSKNSFELKSRGLQDHSSSYTPIPAVHSPYRLKVAVSTVSYSLTTTPDGPPYTSFLIRNKRLASPPISTTKPRLMPEDTTSSVFSATTAEENSTISSSDSFWPHVVQTSSSVRLTPTIKMDSQRE